MSHRFHRFHRFDLLNLPDLRELKKYTQRLSFRRNLGIDMKFRSFQDDKLCI